MQSQRNVAFTTEYFLILWTSNDSAVFLGQSAIHRLVAIWFGAPTHLLELFTPFTRLFDGLANHFRTHLIRCLVLNMLGQMVLNLA